MAQSDKPHVLQRKALAAKRPGEPPAISPDRALSIALAKTAQDRFGLALNVAAVNENRHSLAEILEDLPDLGLFMVLEGPGDALGLMAFDQSLVAGLIEVQTMRKVGRSDLSPRKPTRTDAAMVADFLDAILEKTETALLDHPDLTWMGAYRYASFIDDPRPLGMLLEETSYRVFRVSLNISMGARTGALMLALPAKGRGTAPLPSLPAPAKQANPGWSMALEKSVLAASVQIDAVLHRQSLTLAHLAALKPGDLLALPNAQLDRIRLEGANQKLIGHGRLGQSKHQKAVRLSEASGETADAKMDAAPLTKLPSQTAVA